MKPWNERVVAITGASGGLGLEMAKETARKGGLPVMLARSAEKLEQGAAVIKNETGIRPVVYELDVSDASAVKQVFSKIARETGTVDVLINNAGFGIFDEFEQAKLQDIKEMFEVNVYGLFSCTQAVLPAMRKQGYGHIIHVASQAGKLATPKSGGYSATKHAVLAFANSLRMELEGSGIRVSTVNPGPVRTNFFSRADQTGQYEKSVEKFMLDAGAVAAKTIALIDRPKRELNLPRWMNAGSKIYQLFPGLMEKLAGSQFRKK
ncbi:SDR family NAD(P)-dependent oxidoreductase [Alteribacter natronophilus]|uniref:SDR family NAD(P)-dependent oxidoreductase n=1 Tax=Alteribacter natronophilus TaxID=2583810 RepID=UPI00110F4EE7|nr:SDR family oxidoreductase [Alteribacter natronophilus]TMW73706.1 SDR family oxidoreductase [Alteribacter natronophilus]